MPIKYYVSCLRLQIALHVPGHRSSISGKARAVDFLASRSSMELSGCVRGNHKSLVDMPKEQGVDVRSELLRYYKCAPQLCSTDCSAAAACMCLRRSTGSSKLGCSWSGGQRVMPARAPAPSLRMHASYHGPLVAVIAIVHLMPCTSALAGCK